MSAIAKPAKLAAAEYPIEISNAYQRFAEDSEIVASGVIRAANNARYIGLMFKEWIGHEQMEMEFFTAWVRQNAAQMPEGFTANRVKNFIRIANKLVDPVVNFIEAKEALQLTFEAAGLIEVEKRKGPQNASPITPMVFFMGKLSTVRDGFTKWIEDDPVEKWPDDVRQTVSEEIKWAHELYEKLNK